MINERINQWINFGWFEISPILRELITIGDNIIKCAKFLNLEYKSYIPFSWGKTSFFYKENQRTMKHNGTKLWDSLFYDYAVNTFKRNLKVFRVSRFLYSLYSLIFTKLSAPCILRPGPVHLVLVKLLLRSTWGTWSITSVAIVKFKVHLSLLFR